MSEPRIPKAALTDPLVAAGAIDGSTSDGFHTFDELYAYRSVYNALLFNEWAESGRYPVVKSWNHSDGEPVFGGDWFIVVGTLPTGQVSNHYRAEHWHEFEVPAVDLPPEYDGHSPADALERLQALLPVVQVVEREDL